MTASSHDSWIFSRTGITTACVLAILGFLVYTGHTAHLLGFLPYMFLLACPLMHIFMHGGHHHHKEGEAGSDKNAEHHSHGGGGGCCGAGHDAPKKPSDTQSAIQTTTQSTTGEK